ncbi:MAG: hypothetical protein EON88_24665, partial [Brevundimonas sp.]
MPKATSSPGANVRVSCTSAPSAAMPQRSHTTWWLPIGSTSVTSARSGPAPMATCSGRTPSSAGPALRPAPPVPAGSAMAPPRKRPAASSSPSMKAIGGDPRKVLVFGQSGGGSKTSVLLAMPSAKGLFQRAGVMSGSATTVATREAQAEVAAQLKKALGVGTGQAAKLQALPFTTILAAQSDMEAGQRAKGEAPRSFAPCLDGVVIPRHPFDPDAPAVSADIPMIISSALDERAYRLTNFNLDEAGLRKFAADKVGAAGADALVALYKADDPKASPYLLQCRMDTDQTFRRGYFQQADRKVAQGTAKAWLYLFKAPSPAYGGRYGALHGIDVGLSLHDVRGGLNGPTAENVRLADQLASAWVAFAETGDPNNPKTPAWTPYNAAARPTMVWETAGGVMHNDPRGKFREY